MTRNEFKKYINKTVEIVSQYEDAQGKKTTVEVIRLFNKKAVKVTFWHGATPEVRKKFLDGRFKVLDLCGYPVVFDNRRGGGEVQSYTIMWTEKIN